MLEKSANCMGFLSKSEWNEEIKVEVETSV